MNVPVARIRLDGGTQPRAMIDQIVVADYAEAMREGVSFPPVVVWFDGTDYWLSDGYHRVHAALALNLDTIVADVRTGTQQDAQWHSYGVNATHGLRRTNGDKRRAVEAALRHPNAATMSDVLIAKHCGVSHMTVNRMRKDNFDFNNVKVAHRVGLDGRVINTANIGRTAEPQITHYAPIDPTPPRHEPVEECPRQPVGPVYDAEEEPTQEEQQLPVTHIEEQSMLRPPMAAHQQINQSTNNEWYTPGVYIDAARTVMGHIDLDPASCAYANETVRATRYYSQIDDGLRQPWYGRVWMNPPYGREEGEHDSNQARWTRRIIDEYLAGNVAEAIVLVNAVPGNRWFAPLKNYPICFPDVRIRFYNETTRAGQPTHSNAIVYLGPNVALFVHVFSQFGRVMVPVTAVSSAEYRIDIAQE